MKRLIAVLVCLCAVLSAAAWAGPGRAVNEKMKEGRRLMEAENYQQAKLYFQEALKELGEGSMIQEAGRARLFLARCSMSLSEFDQAAAHLDRGLEIFQKLGDVDGIGQAYFRQADLARTWGDPEAALRRLKLALEAFQSGDAETRKKVSMVHIRMARNLQSLGRDREAREAMDKGVAAARDQAFLGRLAEATLAQGELALEQGDLAGAEAAFREAVDVNRELGQDKVEARCLRSQAKVRLMSGRPDEAMPLLVRALALDEKVGIRQAQSQDLHMMGVAAYDQDQPADAVKSLERAVAIVDDLRRAAQGEQRRGYMSTQVEVFNRLVDAYSAQDDPAGVFRTFERSRARFLAETLAKGESGREPQDLAAFQKTLAPDALALFYCLTGKNRLRILAVTRDAAVLKRNSFKQYGKPVLLMAEAEADASRAEVARGLSAAKASAESLPPPASFREAVVLFRRLASDRTASASPACLQAGRSLAEALLDPVAALLQGKKRLIVIPDGPLALVPFEALPGPSGRLLVQDFDVSYAQSAEVLSLVSGRSHAEGRAPFLALGVSEYGPAPSSPDSGPCTPEALAERIGSAEAQGRSLAFAYACLGLSDLSDIPGVKDELGRVSGLFKDPLVLQGRDASEAAFKRLDADGSLARSRILHLAVHGLAVPEFPQLSTLVLAGAGQGAGGDDGYLRMPEIAALTLDADLTVLSACETGLGRLVQGEGVVGLTGAFLAAGSSGLVASLWNVSDAAAPLLTSAMYEEAAKNPGYAHALAEAKRRMLRGDFGPRFAAPYYWASFIYYGR